VKFDLFSLDILEENVEHFKARGEGLLIEGSVLGAYAIVPIETVTFPGVPCYLPEEARMLLAMSNENAKAAHEIKRAFGGHLKEKNVYIEGTL
jgi:hypothetical protein